MVAEQYQLEYLQQPVQAEAVALVREEAIPMERCNVSGDTKRQLID
jgi:hypothetical protein